VVARIANISIHAANPRELAHVWSAVMGYPLFTGWPDDEVAALRESGMTDDELLERAEAWTATPPTSASTSAATPESTSSETACTST